MLAVGVEGLLQEAQRGRRQGEDLIGIAAHLARQPGERHDAVDEPPPLRLLGAVLAAQEPDLAGALLPHDAGEIAGAEAGVEGPHARTGLAEAGVVGGDRQVADHVQHVPAPDREPVDGRDHRLWDLADHAVELLDFEQAAARGPVVAAAAPLLLVTADAEGPLPRPGERHHPHLGSGPCPLEACDQLLDGVGRERVQALRAVDRDPRKAVLLLVAHIRQLLLGHRPPFLGLLTPSSARR